MISAAEAYSVLSWMGQCMMGYTPAPPPPGTSYEPPSAPSGVQPYRQGPDKPDTPRRSEIGRRRWRCAYCEHDVDIGPTRTVCPNCGAPQGEGHNRTKPIVYEPVTVRKIEGTTVWRDEHPTCPVAYVLH